MNEILAQKYGTREKLAAAQIEKTAEAQMLDELVKIAEAEGIDLDQFSDDDIAGILAEAMTAPTETEKTASTETPAVAPEKEAEADHLGRVMAHAMFDEMSAIQEAANGSEKTASAEEAEFEQAFEAMAIHTARDILAAVGVDVGDHVKTAAPYTVEDPELAAAIVERAGELLDADGWDVDAIAAELEKAE